MKKIFHKIYLALLLIFFYLPIVYTIVFSFNSSKSLTVFEGFSHLEKPDEKSLISEFAYKDSNTAFDAACDSFKALLH